METKWCSKCQRYRNINDFAKHRKSKDGKQHYCKECHNAIHKRWAKENREKALEAMRRWKRSHPRQSIEWEKAHPGYNTARKAKWRSKNRQRVRDTWNAWNKKNPDKKAQRGRNRRARRGASVGKFTPEQWIALCEKYKNKCLCCGKNNKLCADHVVPLSKGGRNSIDNIQPLCGSCNSKKGTKSTDYRH